MVHLNQRAQEVNPAKLALLFRKQFELCNVARGETIGRKLVLRLWLGAE